MDQNIILRPSNKLDAHFAFNVLKITMRDYAIATWGEWHEQESKLSAIEDTRLAKVDIIERNGIAIGVLLVTQTTQRLDIEQLYLLPNYQSQGIGTKILLDLQKKSADLGVSLTLSVLCVNPAYYLYQRLGFKVIKTTSDFMYMEYTE